MEKEKGEEKEKKKKKARRFQLVYRLKNALFFTVLGVLTVVGLLFFLRPETSEKEKRELTKFPQFTLAGLMDGSYARGIDTWYADTYPLREIFIEGNARLRSLYGDQSTVLLNKRETADAVPPPETSAASGAAGAKGLADGNGGPETKADDGGKSMAELIQSGPDLSEGETGAPDSEGDGDDGRESGSGEIVAMAGPGGAVSLSGPGEESGGGLSSDVGPHTAGENGADRGPGSAGENGAADGTGTGAAGGNGASGGNGTGAAGGNSAAERNGTGAVGENGAAGRNGSGTTGTNGGNGTPDGGLSGENSGTGASGTPAERETPGEIVEIVEETFADEEEDFSGEMAGPIYVAGDTAYGLYYFAQEAASGFSEMVNHTYEVLGGEADVYSVIAPLNSAALLSQSLQSGFGASDQGAAIEYIFSLMDSGVHRVNPLPSLKKHNTEYIYFRTDHHWTALGAYYAYEAFAREKGIVPHTLDQFERREYTDFVGSYYSSSQAAAMKANPDTVVAYVPMGTNEMTMVTGDGREMQWRIVNDVSDYRSGAKYSCFAGSDQPYAAAHNPEITDGSACVVIKDSYGNAFVPFLIDHYEYVYWIDFRYYDGTLTDLVREKGISDIIYMIDIDNTTTSSMVRRMRELVP